MAELQIPTPAEIKTQVQLALSEDIGSGDLTSSLIDPQSRSKAVLISKGNGILCGTAWFNEAFRLVDDGVQVDWQVADTEKIRENQQLCEIRGSTVSILTAERVALNFLQSLSGTATEVHRYVVAAQGKVRILDTRKTLPGLRMAQKYAVRCGGGANHRYGLYDAILIKENHIHAVGGIDRIMKEAKERYPHTEIEIEVESIKELAQALDAGAKRILLDNFDMPMLLEAVRLNNNTARLEVSGNLTLDMIEALAKTGVDDISIGALTKDLQAFDFSLRITD